ncbi:MAG: RidA family protein [Actinomycetota bacterium]
MTTRRSATSGGPYEDPFGYCRAVRVGDHVAVAGTVAVDPEGNTIAPGDMYEQTAAVLAIIERALVDVGAAMTDVVRTRSFLTDIGQWEAFGKAHGEAFRLIKPVATAVEVKGLIGDGIVIEIEVDAIVADRSA